jgi:mono/diheme cytochrome c family protein
MNKTIRSQVVLAVVVSLAGAAGFAQSPGETIYKAKCQSCHGATGLADTTVGKALKVKPITDTEVMNFGEGRMIDATTNGMGKMQPFKGKLTDAEIKDAVAYFRTFIKK